MLNLLKSRIAPAVVAGGLALAGLGFSANATTLLVFGQDGGANVVVATQTTTDCTFLTGTLATCHTDIDIIDAAITVTSFFGGVATPFSANLRLEITSTDYAGTIPVPNQPFSGFFCITAGLNCTGADYLSATFTDLVFGAGTAIGLVSADPPDTINFTSDFISPLDLIVPRGIVLGFTNVTPVGSLCPPGNVAPDHQTYCSFTSNVAGNMSAQTRLLVPEPGTLALLGLGLAGLGLARRRKSA